MKELNFYVRNSLRFMELIGEVLLLIGGSALLKTNSCDILQITVSCVYRSLSIGHFAKVSIVVEKMKMM